MSDTNNDPKNISNTQPVNPLTAPEAGGHSVQDLSEVPAVNTSETLQSQAPSPISTPTPDGQTAGAKAVQNALFNPATQNRDNAPTISAPQKSFDRQAREAIEGTAQSPIAQLVEEDSNLATQKRLATRQLEKQWESYTDAPKPQAPEQFAAIIDDLFSNDKDNATSSLNYRDPNILASISSVLGITAAPAAAALPYALRQHWKALGLPTPPADKTEHIALVDDLVSQFQNDNGYTTQQAYEALHDNAQQQKIAEFMQEHMPKEPEFQGPPQLLVSVQIPSQNEMAQPTSEIQGFLPGLDDDLKQHILNGSSGDKYLSLTEPNHLMILLEALPGLQKERAVIDALKAKAKELNIDFDDFMLLSRTGGEHEIIRRKKTINADGTEESSLEKETINPRAMALDIFLQNSSMLPSKELPNRGYKGFKLLSGHSGKVTDYELLGHDGTRFVHKNKVSTIIPGIDEKTGKPTAVGAGKVMGGVLSAILPHLNPNADGSPQEMSITITSRGHYADRIRVRDMSLIEALQVADDQNINMGIKVQKESLFIKRRSKDKELDAIKIDKATGLILNIDYNKLSASAVSAMTARGIDVKALCEKFNAQNAHKAGANVSIKVNDKATETLIDGPDNNPADNDTPTAGKSAVDRKKKKAPTLTASGPNL